MAYAIELFLDRDSDHHVRQIWGGSSTWWLTPARRQHRSRRRHNEPVHRLRRASDRGGGPYPEDSTILGVFVGVRNQLGEGRVRLVATDPAVLRIFHVTGLDQVFTFHPTRDQALSSA